MQPFILSLVFCHFAFLGSLSAEARSPELEEFCRKAVTADPQLGPRASEALIAGMPSADREELAGDYLLRNLNFALKARREFPWSKDVSEKMFFNDVLPYAVLDETREDWRPEFYLLSKRLVKDCETASAAAQVLNRDLFNELGFHYNTGRKKPNQSPSESQASGKATCTGLSIALVYACRSVGIPARIVGTPLWSDKSGNHSWVEIWDGEWKFLGADEYDAKGLNRGWFTHRAAQARADEWQHAIWATSWDGGEHHFPMVWDMKNHEVGAVNVTARYLPNNSGEEKSEEKFLSVSVVCSVGGPRVEARVSLYDRAGELVATAMSKAGRADLNDVARLPVTGEGPWRLLVTGWGKQQERVLSELPTATLSVALDDGAVEQVKESKEVSPGLDVTALVKEWEEGEKAVREKELQAKVIPAAGKEMRFLEKVFGEAPAAGHALWISMHGGGGAPPAVNDGQWKNQIRLYQPAEGYYVAPRAPTDTWNLWHEGHIDELFDRLIANYVICRGVDPNRIYLMGYSAGGDGVYQLAPRMADRFAAASMMAGHPNETQPDGLRNLPFEIFMGGQDGAYDRNKIAAKWKILLQEQQAKDPEGYPHRVTIYPECGHWMNGQDGEALPRMAAQSRKEWPRRVVWLQDDVTHERFYWLGVSKEGAKKGRRLVGEVKGQTITIEGRDVSGLRLWLSDELLDLDQEIVVLRNGKEAFRGQVPRSGQVVSQSLAHRSGMVATALLELD